MKHAIHGLHRTGHRIGIKDRFGVQFGTAVQRFGMACGQIVQDHDRIASAQQSPHEMAADEACPASHKIARHNPDLHCCR